MACTECHAPARTGHPPERHRSTSPGARSPAPAAPPHLERHGPHLRQLLPRRHPHRRHASPSPSLDRAARSRSPAAPATALRRRPRTPPSPPPRPAAPATPATRERHGEPRHPRERRPRRRHPLVHLLPRHAGRPRPPSIPSSPRRLPSDTKGNTATTTRAVGAHQRHLVAGALSAAIACTECHTVPHQHRPLERRGRVAFGTLARTGTRHPDLERHRLRLPSYCHGGFNERHHHLRPHLDRRRRAGQRLRHLPRRCPPAAPHPPSATCGTCHTGYTATTVNVDHPRERRRRRRRP